MNEWIKTISFFVAALLLGLLAFATTPGDVNPAIFNDQGKPFYENFNPGEAVSLEMFSKNGGGLNTFKVEVKDGAWRLPSYHYYPADGKERLKKSAFSLKGLKRDRPVGDNPKSYADFNVLDPLDKSLITSKGTGVRITLRNSSDEPIFDMIIGKELENSPGYRYMRLPSKGRVYAVKADIDLSTKFSDWIETDLLKADQSDLNKIIFDLHDYDENAGGIVMGSLDKFELRKKENGSDWDILKDEKSLLNDKKIIETTVLNSLLEGLSNFKIIGIHKKPDMLIKVLNGEVDSKDLDPFSNAIIFSNLKENGFRIERGRLAPVQGHCFIETEKGIRYTLQFGEETLLKEEAVSSKAQKNKKVHGRFLLISVDYIPELFPQPKKEAIKKTGKAKEDKTAQNKADKAYGDKLDKWKKQVAKTRKKVEELKRRFESWYYIVNDEKYKQIRKRSKDFIIQKKDDKKTKAPKATPTNPLPPGFGGSGTK